MTAPNDQLAQWAALFLDKYSSELGSAQAPAAPAYVGVSAAASSLLQSVDAGGVPAFITAQLKSIAEDNGIAVGAGSTPNEIIAALRRLARPAPSAGPA
jgi:hypothetical protein